MPDWTAPFHLPKFTDAEFKAMRQKYAAKYGYTVEVPGLSEIIRTDPFERMTFEEIRAWKRRDYEFFSPGRYYDIRQMKQRKKERFLRMLASPTPDIIMHIGSIMTSLDDCQDALITIGYLGKVVARMLPKTLGKAFLGPVGWVLAAADLMRFCTIVSAVSKGSIKGQRRLEAITNKDNKALKAKIRKLKRLRDITPHFSDIIQILQTTEQIFGFGVCLGPILGLAQDLFSGFIRTVMGQTVHFKAPPTTLPVWLQSVCDALKGAGYVLSNPFETDEPMLTDVIVAAYIGNQVMAPILKQWHPFDNVPNIQDLHFMAPIPKDPLTIEIIEEEGFEVLATCGWPHNNQMWTTMDSFVESSADIASDNLRHMIDLNKDNRRGDLIGQMANEIALQSMANLVGEENVVYDYSAANKAAGVMLYNGYHISEDATDEQIKLLTDWLDEFDAIEEHPDFKELYKYCSNNRIPLIPFVPELARP